MRGGCARRMMPDGDLQLVGAGTGSGPTWPDKRHKAKYGAFLVYAPADNYTLRVWDGTHQPVDEVRERTQNYLDRKELDTAEGEGRIITQ